uniref:PAS domain-containing protein n=1 Tax=uncultured Mucilaginibacter sp. TaxID=797541 RepID=UPI0025D06424
DNQITVKFDQWQNMVHPDDFPLIKNALNIALKTGESATVEYRVKKLNGEIVWLMGGGKVSKEANNNTQHLMGTALNITARKNAEQNKEHYTIALEEMLFAISHKFRKPVANIFGLVNVLSNPAITPEKIHECVPYLKGFADEIDSYIRELNSFVEQKQTHMSENDK